MNLLTARGWPDLTRQNFFSKINAAAAQPSMECTGIIVQSHRPTTDEEIPCKEESDYLRLFWEPDPEKRLFSASVQYLQPEKQIAFQVIIINCLRKGMFQIKGFTGLPWTEEKHTFPKDY